MLHYPPFRTTIHLSAKQNVFLVLTERTGSIVKVENEKTERQSVQFEKEISTASEAGLLGFVLAPDFLESHRAYA